MVEWWLRTSFLSKVTFRCCDTCRLQVDNWFSQHLSNFQTWWCSWSVGGSFFLAHLVIPGSAIYITGLPTGFPTTWVTSSSAGVGTTGRRWLAWTWLCLRPCLCARCCSSAWGEYKTINPFDACVTILCPPSCPPLSHLCAQISL